MMSCLEFKEALFPIVVKMSSLNAIGNLYIFFCNFVYIWEDSHSKGLPHGLLFYSFFCLDSRGHCGNPLPMSCLRKIGFLIQPVEPLWEALYRQEDFL